MTSEACDLAKAENRTTISSKDILDALRKLGFDDYYEEVKRYAKLYEEAKKKSGESSN